MKYNNNKHRSTTYQNATKISAKVSRLEKIAKTIQYIIHLTWKKIIIRATLDIQYCIYKKSWHEWDLKSYVYATCHVTCINMSIAFHICESHNVIMWSWKMPQRCNTGQFLKRKGILPVANLKKKSRDIRVTYLNLWCRKILWLGTWA